MIIGSAMASGMQGVMTGMRGLSENAHTLARQPVAQQQGERSQMVPALVDSKVDLTQVQASSKVLQASSDTMGSIINIMA
ncbi:MAG: hypothetical protein HQL49_10215 [Gammaproteobacteria bacterium]|nr:hypothetical protein [Gammaproteobacteria bacterium]